MNHETQLEPQRPRDEGSVLPMILALMVVGSLAVVALLTFATTLFMNRPPIEVRDQTFWSAKSAMSMAMTLQREHGPDGCYQPTDSFVLNGFTAQVTCTPTGNYFGTGRGRYAVITTDNDPSVVQLAGRGPTAAGAKSITGNVFVNGGGFGDLTTDVAVSTGFTGVPSDVVTSNFASVATPAARYFDPSIVAPAPPAPTDCSNPVVHGSIAFPAAGTDWSPTCQAQAWWDFAGDFDTTTSTYEYPELPPLPAYLRPSVPQATVGSCNVYYPGRYETPLTLGAGRHYFPSGIYYFEDVVTLSPGAELVAGDGRWAGCTFDAEAAFAPTAPNFHAITGRGATLVFGDAGRLIADNASLRINRRVSDSTSRGSETIAIRSVNFRTAAHSAPAAVEVPDDVVFVGDVYDGANPACNASLSTATCLQRVADHTVRATPSAPISRYRASTLAPTDTIISITQTGGSASTNQFITDGYVFVPNSRVLLTGGANTDYRLRLSAGLVASSLELGYDAPPASAANWFLGVLDEPIQRQVDLFVSVTAPNGQRTVSRAIMEVNIDESYAINGWTVDPNAGAVTTTAPPTTAPPVTTTTDPAAPTTTVDPATTTTTTTTLPPPPPPTVDAPCNVPRGSWTRDFGDSAWTAEFWDFGSSMPNPLTNPFPDAPDVTQTVTEVFKPNDNSPPSGLGAAYADLYTARFTLTFEAGAACTIDLQRGSDDGMRVKVNGATVIDDWAEYAYKTSSVSNVPIVAGTNTIVVEYYERAGQSGYELVWQD
jgi:hypothetical protein